MLPSIVTLFFVVLCACVHGQNQTDPEATLPFYSDVPSGRIVNGQTVSIQSYPFIVGLRINNVLVCGGSIITVKHVLTAAHCLANRPAIAAISLRAGSTSQFSGGYFFAVATYVMHRFFNAQTFDNDVAVITITTSFVGYPNVGRISLQDMEIAPTSCYALGWGATSGASLAKSTNLQMTSLQTISNAFCATFYAAGRITTQMICAQSATRDTCSGDDGGPLVCNGRLTGIISFGITGCQGKYPAVFGKIWSGSVRYFILYHTGI